MYGCSGPSMLHGLLSSGGEQGYSPVAVCERLIALAFLVVECGLWGEESSVVAPMGSVAAAPGL